MLKKAFLVGINAYSDSPLRGCVNDVKAMKELLKSLYGFAEDNIRLIADKEATTKGIVDGLTWLAEGGDEKAVRVFHYAGHGHFAPDKNGDESDGSDEALVPYDYRKTGYLIDDKLKELYDRFPANGNLTLIMDCCHSGSINRGPEGSDIYYRFIPNTYAERKAIAAAKRKFHEEQRQFVMSEVRSFAKVRGRDNEFERRIEEAMQKFEKQRFGDLRVREGNILLAACQSDQQAADAKMSGAYRGAFTFYLIKFLREANGKITYRDLIEKVGKTLDAAKFVQVPQLECMAGREKAQALSLF
jgi:hypothetical protein